MKIYLCGAINNQTDEQCKGWRETAKAILGKHECIDPMRRDYRGRETENYKEIVEKDIEDIISSDVVLAMAEIPSWGTAMEIYIASTLKKPTYAVRNGRISPWLLYHCSSIHPSLQEAITAIQP